MSELEALGIRIPSRDQVGVVAGYNLSGGTPARYVGSLVQRGMIAIPTPGKLQLTQVGVEQAAPAARALTNEDAQRRVLTRLNSGERKILEHLIAIYPHEATRPDVGTAVGYNLSGGTPARYVGKLTTLNLVEIPGPGLLRATDILFPEGA
jgi:hypothetical protein